MEQLVLQMLNWQKIFNQFSKSSRKLRDLQLKEKKTYTLVVLWSQKKYLPVVADQLVTLHWKKKLRIIIVVQSLKITKRIYKEEKQNHHCCCLEVVLHQVVIINQG
ncbi:hypothetical protein ISN45_Aa06g036010 [Arabidopsis thaliana x Arabidopsis arenosa]|uniref:Uncharacterized protein n=1 Tax=Arabidopsis thaliana x Arabidopsis arenosa TaxID=1240361 RepID=A0A8T1Z2Z5_9BRAS|nr:hypothetical protein ISN45_Aa06g036010 [Arabidopsis thaliana x Arabidopsis arenosa]